jgi:hypothetical protein
MVSLLPQIFVSGGAVSNITNRCLVLPINRKTCSCAGKDMQLHCYRRRAYGTGIVGGLTVLVIVGGLTVLVSWEGLRYLYRGRA